jgi:type VI secretion system protein ImpL
MDKYRMQLLEIQSANSNWWVPRFGLNKSLEVEKALRKHFLSMFEKGFLHPIDREMEKNLEGISAKTPEKKVVKYAQHLVGRIKLLEMYLKNESLDSPEDISRFLPNILTLFDSNLLPEIAAKFKDIYIYYLDCGISRATAYSKVKELRRALVELINKKGVNINWLIGWANSDLTLHGVCLDDFWGPGDSKRSDKKIVVDAACTVDGHKRINEFIKCLEDALIDVVNISDKKGVFRASVSRDAAAFKRGIDISDKKEVFNRYYQRKYLRAWKNFAGSFSYGEHNLNSLDGWQAMASKMTTPHNPYFELLERMNKELQPFANEKNVPSWVKQIIELQTIFELASRERKAKKDPSLLTKITGKGTKLAGEVKKKVETGPEKEADKKHIYAATAFNDYLKNLEELLSVSSARSQAYKAASAFYSYGVKPSESKSPFFRAYGNIRKLKSSLITPGDSSLCSKLVSGPVDLLVHYASMETACSLQHSWEDIVLGEIQGVSKDKLPDLLFGKQGVVWKFVNGPAAPFLGRNQKGYFTQKARGSSISFKNDFISFLTQGSEAKTSIQSEYKVQVKALPVGVNDKAKEDPYEVVLELWCAKGKTRLENYNYPTSKIFVWSPQDCGDVTLQINFEGLSLVKKYAGCNGFPLFLADFRHGSKTFKPGDFPGSEGILKKMNVSEIKVIYEFKDSAPVIKLLKKVPQKTLEIIADCWDR